MSEFSIRGLEQLKTLFNELGTVRATKVLRSGAAAGAKIVRTAVQTAAPQRQQIVGRRGSTPGRAPGTLKRSIFTKFLGAQSGEGQATYLVGARSGKRAQQTGRDAFYAPFVERGHRIVPRAHRGLGRKSVTLRRQEAQISGGRVPAHPFMAPAFAATYRVAADKMVDVMGRALQREIER